MLRMAGQNDRARVPGKVVVLLSPDGLLHARKLSSHYLSYFMFCLLLFTLALSLNRNTFYTKYHVEQESKNYDSRTKFSWPSVLVKFYWNMKHIYLTSWIF